MILTFKESFEPADQKCCVRIGLLLFWLLKWVERLLVTLIKIYSIGLQNATWRTKFFKIHCVDVYIRSQRLVYTLRYCCFLDSSSLNDTKVISGLPEEIMYYAPLVYSLVTSHWTLLQGLLSNWSNANKDTKSWKETMRKAESTFLKQVSHAHLSSSRTSLLLWASTALGILCCWFCVVAVVNQPNSSECLPTKVVDKHLHHKYSYI